MRAGEEEDSETVLAGLIPEEEFVADEQKRFVVEQFRGLQRRCI
jgi:hypothetical protein